MTLENKVRRGPRFCIVLPILGRRQACSLRLDSWILSAVLVCCATFVVLARSATAADRSQWGEAWSRNQVSPETHLPAVFDPESGLNIQWSVPLGTETHSTPVLSNGRILIGTNNEVPRDARHTGDRGILMCLNEEDGRLLWQLVVPKRDEDPYFDWPRSGISSPATIEGDRAYIVSNRGEVLCLDMKGMEDGNDGPFREEGIHMTPSKSDAGSPGPLDADILWLLDLTREAGIWSHDAAHSSILLHGDHLYLNTGTGVDNTHRKIRLSDSPSLVVVDKNTGKLLAREKEGIAPLIFHCTWSAPSLGLVNGKPQIYFAGGNGVLYSFLPLPSSARPADPIPGLKTIWSFDCDPDAPKSDVHRFHQNKKTGPSNIYGMPVFHEESLFVAGGGDYWWGKLEAWLKRVDATGSGDVTSTSEMWSYPLNRHVMATPAIQDGLVFIADCGRTLHCVDEKTGRPVWTQDIRGDVWASALVADGKVYQGTRSGDFYVLRAHREKELLHHFKFDHPISATPVAANGTLYIATMSELFAMRLRN